MADAFNPSRGLLHSTLRDITERLARDLASPGPLAPQWSDWEWTLAQAVSAMHGVSSLLSAKLRWQGPANWSRFLSDQRAHTTVRHARIARLLAELDARSRAAGVAAVALKGAALHAAGLYSPGERPMADVDLLVRPADVRPATELLEELGFRKSHTTWKETVFLPRLGRPSASLGEHSDNDLKIELHERICERLPWRLSDISACVHPPASRPGLNPYPSPAALLLHMTFHAAGAMTAKALRLLHLHDLALLSMRMRSADWERFLALPGESGLWWAYPPLRLLGRYYPTAIPHAVLDELGRRCPVLLQQVARRRALTDVSYSHPWVDAFPGIEWCQSFGDAVRYIANRIRPSRGQLEWRATVLETEAWAGRSAWSAQSQSRRMVRWLTSRPVRPVAMHAIAVAFGKPPP